jgi:hypothetical protein
MKNTKMINFIHCDNPDRLEAEALIHLNNAIVKSRSNMTLNEVLDNARNKTGTIYTIQNDKVIGAMYLERLPEVLSLTLLGGNNIRGWGKELVAFIRSLLKAEGLSHICVIGRCGWQGLFSEMQPVGMLYVAA